jgi:tight adherence protein B
LVAAVNGLLALALGAGIGLGALLIVFGLTGRAVVPEVDAGGWGAQGGRHPGRLLVRAGLAAAAALVAIALTGWVAAGLLVVLGVMAAPSVLAARRKHEVEVAKVEAIASWAEMLRDTMAAASGLEQAIAASAAVAPAPLASAVHRLAARLDHLRLADALRAFADEVDHPTCDFVVAGLITAAEHQARELGPLLGQLAACARDEAQLRARVWAGRARTRTSVRVITGCVATFAVGLLVLDRSYLRPFGTATGQVALFAIGAIFAGSVAAMARMGRIELPERFMGRRQVPI